jgi:hypothetical protein
VSQGGSPSVSGVSHVTGVTLNGIPIVVTGAANQTVPLLDGQMIINEQITSGSGGMASITVNALHITLSGGSSVTLGSSSSGVVAGSQNCSSPDDFTTGGGWLPPAGSSKRSFGFIGGVKQGSTFAGHLVFVNHQTNERLQGQVTAYSGTGTMRHMDGTGQADNETATFQLDVIDNGEPGTTDHFTLSYQTPTRTRAEDGDIGGGNIQIHEVCH